MKLGTDIEVFLTDQNNNPKNAFGIIKGTKEFPYEWEQGYFTSLDCVLLEYNTPPRESKEDFKQDIKKSLNYLQSIIPEGDKLSFLPAYEFSESELFTVESKIFGCSPDFNAWTNKVNVITDAAESNLRTGGRQTCPAI